MPAVRVLQALEEFARDKSKASGHRSHCKACDREKARAFYAENREREQDRKRT